MESAPDTLPLLAGSRPAGRARDLRDGAALAAIAAAGLAFAGWSGCPWLLANVLVLGLPLAYLLLTAPEVRRRLDRKFILLLVLFGTAAFDSLARRTDAWGGESLLPFHLPGEVSFEELQWILFFFPLTLALNERFFAVPGAGAGSRRAVSKPFLKAGFYLGLVIVCIPVRYLPLEEYAYLKIGCALYLPAILLALWIQPRLIRELVATGIVTGLLNLAFEVVAVRHGYWTFPGHYLGWVTVFGATFPVEEMIFLVLLSGPSLVATYAIAKNWRLNRRSGGAAA